MSRIKRLLMVILIVMIFFVINVYTVYARPDSSKGFAEYSDNIAEEEYNKLEKEQKQHLVLGKSTNNYLDNLKVDGHKISPEFEKQTLEYTLTQPVNTEEINIVADVNDERAKVEGIGKVNLQYGQNKCRVEVTAESGTVRTYIINVERIQNNENNVNNENEENEENDVNEISEENVKKNFEDNIIVKENENVKIIDKKNINIRNIIIILIIFLIVSLILIILNKNSKKR